MARMQKDMKLPLGRERPGSFPPDTVFPAPLAPGADPAAWAARRAAIRDRWLAFLGPFPDRCDLRPRELDAVPVPGGVRRKVRYCAEMLGAEPLWTEAYLFVPGGDTGRRPAVVVFHPTSHDIEEPAGLSGPPSLHTALHLLQRGYVVLCPRNFLWDWPSSATPTATASPASSARPAMPGSTGF